ncbi:MAG: hypothetical protein QM813_25790 [Verrucomicrobiota bacterium]
MMKRLTIVLMLAGLGFAGGAFVVGRHQASQHAREIAASRAAWDAEKAELEASLAQARAQQSDFVSPPTVQPTRTTAQSADPKTLLAKLANLKVDTSQGRAMRPVIALLEQLAQTGPAALPIIRDFLASGQDLTYSAPGGKTTRDIRTLTETLAPATLRFALFDVTRQIGGGRRKRFLWKTSAARNAEWMSPISPSFWKRSLRAHTGKTSSASRAICWRPAAWPPAQTAITFTAVPQRFNDNSYVATAKTQVVQPDGKVDRNALRYLQQTLGEQSVAVAAQAYQDSRLTEPGSKEPLARVALAYVGANDQAIELYHAAVLDSSLQPDQKRELVEDLNQDGLSNRKTPTPEDLKIIANRYALTQAYLQQDYVQNDKTLNAAFHEANKDLGKMLEKANAAAQTGR